MKCLKTRVGITTGTESVVAYTNRNRILHLPFEEAVELARKFSSAGGEYVVSLL